MSLKAQVTKGFVWSSLQRVGSQVISFLVFLILARLLEPEDFGLVAMAAVAVTFFKLFSNFGFGAAIVQRKKLETGHLDTAFWVDIFIGITMMAIALLSANSVANLYNEPRIESIFKALSLLFIPSALCQVQTNILRKALNFKPLAIRTVGAEIVGGVIGVACAIAGFGIWSLVAKQLAAAFAGTFILWLLSDWKPGLKVTWRYFKDLFGFSVKMLGANIVAFLSSKSDTFLIGYFLGPLALGYYTIALRVVSLLVESMGGTINQVIWPAFAKLQNDPGRIRAGFYSASEMLALIIMPVFLGIFATANNLVPFVFGEKWEPSIPILQILVVMGVISSMSKMYDSIMVAVGRPGLWLGLRTVIGISSILGFFIGLHWNLTGIALAYTIVAFLSLPVYLFALKKLVNINILTYFKAIVAPVFAAILMAYVVILAGNSLQSIESSGLQLFILVTLGGSCYCLCLALVSPDSVRKLLALVKTLWSKKNKQQDTL